MDDITLLPSGAAIVPADDGFFYLRPDGNIAFHGYSDRQPDEAEYAYACQALEAYHNRSHFSLHHSLHHGQFRPQGPQRCAPAHGAGRHALSPAGAGRSSAPGA